MKFVDEVQIHVIAGSGGAGCVSFCRQKHLPRGGPDGGDGGDGGSVYLKANQSLTTLVDYRYRRLFKAGNGQPGMGKGCIGPSAKDLIIEVPVGTRVSDQQTQESIGDLTEHDQGVLVAKGGFHGLGNMRFKSATNRSPRQSSNGYPGEERKLLLELNLLADVGLLGLPNAGKSSLLNKVSSARVRCADYPFTTLYPQLGVVYIQPHQGFMMADLPGLIEGAARGAGLGIRFLRHLRRTRLLLHLVDMALPDPMPSPVEQINTIVKELRQFDPLLADKERWLVLNKIDLLNDPANDCRQLIKSLAWQKPVYMISAVCGQGTQQLVGDIMDYLEKPKSDHGV